MLDELFEIFEDGLEDFLPGGAVGIISETFQSEDLEKIVTDASTVATAADLVQGDITISTMLSLLKDRS